MDTRSKRLFFITLWHLIIVKIAVILPMCSPRRVVKKQIIAFTAFHARTQDWQHLTILSPACRPCPLSLTDSSPLSLLLQSRELARRLVERGHKGTVLSREEFEEKKAAAQAAEAEKSNTFYNRTRPVWVTFSPAHHAHWDVICMTNTTDSFTPTKSQMLECQQALLYSENWI